ncbi:MAG: peptidoglycan DD-metalloendopeptidase family protein [Dehalococcoidia bacterium]
MGPTWRDRVFTSLVAAGTFAVLYLIAAVTRPVGASAADATLAFPAPGGTQWSVLAGYNTVTHSEADANDPYAIDLHRTDGPTEGTPVLAPIAGTVRYVSSSCASIRDGAGTSVLMCHILVPQSLRGQTVARGQRLGIVAPPGEAGNNGTPHIHLALSKSGPVPFTGTYTIEGIALPPTTEPNAYSGTPFTSSNRETPSVDAGADVSVRPGAAVALSAVATNPSGAGLVYAWTQTGGTAVALASDGPRATFTAPSRTGTLQFRVAVTDGSDVVTDTVRVTVSSSAATPTPAPAPAPAVQTGRFAATPVFTPGGHALAVFRRGSIAQLEAAARGSGASGVWAQDASGRYQLLILDGASFLRDQFIAQFPGGFATDVAVTLVR